MLNQTTKSSTIPVQWKKEYSQQIRKEKKDNDAKEKSFWKIVYIVASICNADLKWNVMITNCK